jgi:hypothetical protein
MKQFLLAVLLLVMPSVVLHAETQCFGEVGYRVCTDVYTDLSGNMRVRSYDTEGNTYSLDTDTYHTPGGGLEVRSKDSEGNSYTLKSWSDSTGAHSEDSEGNRCTITTSGQVIGCGE